MKDFNAQKARQIVGDFYSHELHNILQDIKALSEQGETKLQIRRPLYKATVNALLVRGFDVTVHTSMAIERDGLYYSIFW